MKECVNSNNSKHKEDDSRNDNTYNLNSLEPNLVIPTYSLEHAPETVAEVEPYCYEPYEIDNEYPYVSECVHEEGVRILSFASAEFEELHLSPEVGKIPRITIPSTNMFFADHESAFALLATS